ncbi:MAG TPA: chemotaxis-specific protein-glutamate methyltransferase CheB [Kofleriaceae bacterium]|jgi:two-component system chemotaxis response regulator CheB|nr:chemotaxis-specific protein-glutamate methyltransferase CheB [Kofleriaceae bacterium]
MSGPREVRVLVIDDSPYNRESIRQILEHAPGVRVVGHASDGNEGLRQVIALEPDIITLDLEMPRMDGYTFLRILMSRRPTPVVVVSSHSHRESVFKALELGAVDFIAKPARPVAPELETIADELVAKVTQVARLQPVRLRARPETRASTERAAVVPPPAPAAGPGAAGRALGLVCIGASTGGPPALKEIFEALPADLAVAVLVSQHMPPSFTGPFARRLDGAGGLRVREAADGDVLVAGTALVAPGSGSLVVSARPGGELAVTIEPAGADRTRIVPSIDRMMDSAARAAGRNTLGVVLTGMGDDGSRGVQAIRAAGGVTMAESEKSAVIFGMPESAVRTGAVDEVLPLEAIAAAIIKFARALPR